ncbi:unnamed protein product [Arabis nemorensis]|uniref:KIB1-4 beta-propeller domain-containing protein n=1 Tax=Arabis nemorensis TaxID=586526 RepID=A0A565BKG7_9BRAS|nr:unnamed protein product [Arabis nemorensis]
MADTVSIRRRCSYALQSNPNEDKVYNSLIDFSGTRFLANSGKWFLVLDSRSNLYIEYRIDAFRENRIDLPPLESLLSSTSSIKHVGDEEFKREETGRVSNFILRANVQRGLLWVDAKTGEYVVVWFFDTPATYLSFCKKGDAYYTDIPLRLGVPKLLPDYLMWFYGVTVCTS